MCRQLQSLSSNADENEMLPNHTLFKIFTYSFYCESDTNYTYVRNDKTNNNKMMKLVLKTKKRNNKTKTHTHYKTHRENHYTTMNTKKSQTKCIGLLEHSLKKLQLVLGNTV